MVASTYIELVGKTIAVLEALRDEPRGLGIQKLAERAGLVKSTAHRIAQSLKHHGYVHQDGPGGRYRLGLPILSLARGVEGGTGIPEHARPYLRDLASRFQESSYLAVLRGGRAVFVEVCESPRDLRHVGPLGAEVYFHATAAGKILAAFMPRQRQEQVLAGGPLPRLTGRTMTDPAKVRREWAAARRAGYALNAGETVEGVVFVAAPLFDAQGQICASLSVSIPDPRFTRGLGKQIGRHLVDCGREISAKLRHADYVHRHAFAPEPGAPPRRGSR